MEADGYGRGLRNCTICTCGLVVTVAISDAGLLELYTRKSVTIHNCPRWVALHIMNVEDNKVV